MSGVGQEEYCRLAEWESVTFVALCRRFGITPKTGYKWLARFRAEGEAERVAQAGLANFTKR